MANFTYDYVFHHMTFNEINMANVALDIAEKELESQLNKKQK